MPRNVINVDVLRQYIAGVMDRAEDHAKNVNEICLAIAGAIVWKSEQIFVKEHKGEMKNVLWMHIGERKYALSYKHDSGQIELRENSIHGPVLASFSNATSISEVKRFFESL